MIQILSGGLFGELTYFYIDDTTNHGFIIDPGANAEAILKLIDERGWTIEKILITHGHVDHILAAPALKEALGCEIVIHQEGEKYLADPEWNLTGDFGETLSFAADRYVAHGDVIALEANPDFAVKVIHAPGHTADGVAYYSEKEGVAFVGDIIFQGSVGRSDLPGGNTLRLLSAIRAQIFTLPDDTVLFPGHGERTTVKSERETSPVFNFYD